ncbi:mitochondrial inner membrane protease subunit 1 [[Candida] jaroonii]|uniref:Mitochondrial inner membrane protease subunit 1 n=1 Tax=[Candida] jaroonii TaxID=467808 RepID=A0ACA9Y4X8_9ASCO|nr:mitochondrial inner membrane protease subunit 1 [[Candida] jaroonii]
MESLKFLKTTLIWTLKAGCLIHLVNENLYEFNETRGESMLPTLQSTNDYIHGLKWFSYKDLDIGDVIIAIKPSDPNQRVCKRITGMPGDIILVDPSSSSPLTYNQTEIVKNDGFNKFIKIPKGHVWVTGDNLCHSLDSRSYSVLPMALIKGKIIAANSLNKGFISEDGDLWFWNFRRISNLFI